MWYPSEAAPDVIRIMGCDPGTSTLGLSIIEVHIDNLDRPKCIWAYTLSVKNKTHPSEIAQLDGERSERIKELEKMVEEVIRITRPTFFATETPFMRKGKMSAFESGIELQLMLRRAIRRVSNTLVINGYNPMMVKHFVGVDHIKTPKLAVQVAVRDLYKGHTEIDIMELDEHSSDSIAVCHTFYRKEILREGPLFVRPKKDPSKVTRRPRRRRKKKVKV